MGARGWWPTVPAGRWGVALALAAIAGGCTAGGDIRQPGTPGSPGDGADSTGPGPAVSTGPAECTVDPDCEGPDRALLSELAEPAAPPGAVVASHCGYASFASTGDGFGVAGPTCECEIEGLGIRSLGPVGIGCHATGRGGDCLFEDADFAGCEQRDADSCEASCALLHERLSDDAARTFSGEIVAATCERGACRRIVQIEDQCFPAGSYRYGQGYDCALGVDGVFAAHAAANRDPTETLDFIEASRYPLGSDGILELEFTRGSEFVDGEGFGASAQFYPTASEASGFYGEVVDPLDGPDDCGMVRYSNLGGPTLPPEFLRVERLVLIDGEREIPLQEGTSATPGDGYYAYFANLSELDLTPRFGGAYGLRGEGGSFGTRFELEGIAFPEALVSNLDHAIRLDPQALTLRWQGSGAGPLRVYFGLRSQLSRNDGQSVEIACELTDDGEHTFDPSIFEPFEANFASIYLSREVRGRYTAGGKTLATRTQVASQHDVAWGPGCDGSEALAACHAAADRIRSVHAACHSDQVPTREELCPAVLQEACGTCAEYFECVADRYACGPSGLSWTAGHCACP